MANKKRQPLDDIQWMNRDRLLPNDYNPNKVAPPEMKLLKISILEDGWTQPIVINSDYSIVDGFHRWTLSGDNEIYALTDGKVPVVVLNETTDEQKIMATIRHNRARGTHGVLEMSNIVAGLVEQGLSGEEIMKRLMMEKEEVTRLLFRSGIPSSDVFKDKEFSNAWTPA
jgi:ParB-like chromosome segregation protein Spo0J